jgi:hypothetical protein
MLEMALDIFFHQDGLIREEHLPLLHFTLLELEIVQPGGSYDVGLLWQLHLVSRCSLPCLLLLMLKVFIIFIAFANFSKHRCWPPLLFASLHA